MAINNAIGLKDEGTAYLGPLGAFVGVGGSTAGYVLTSNGTLQQPTFQAVAGSSEVLTAKVTLTSLQIKALMGTPIEIIPAPGAGKVIMPISIYYYFLYGGTNAFTNGQLISTRTNNAGVYTSIFEFPIQSSTIIASASALLSSNMLSGGGVFSVNVTDMINKNVVVINTGASEITGNAANNNTLTVAIAYYVWTL